MAKRTNRNPAQLTCNNPSLTSDARRDCLKAGIQSRSDYLRIANMISLQHRLTFN